MHRTLSKERALYVRQTPCGSVGLGLQVCNALPYLGAGLAACALSLQMDDLPMRAVGNWRPHCPLGQPASAAGAECSVWPSPSPPVVILPFPSPPCCPLCSFPVAHPWLAPIAQCPYPVPPPWMCGAVPGRNDWGPGRHRPLPAGRRGLGVLWSERCATTRGPGGIGAFALFTGSQLGGARGQGRWGEGHNCNLNWRLHPKLCPSA